jgi:hypothetical protein
MVVAVVLSKNDGCDNCCCGGSGGSGGSGEGEGRRKVKEGRKE